MKVILVTIVIGNEYFEEYKRLFYESQKNYALQNGYDFKVINNFLDENIQTYSTISFNKILVCNQEWSKNYDFIIFIDADILINVNSPPIHNYIDYDTCIGIIDEYSQPSKERRINIQKKMGWEITATEYYKLCGFDIETDKVFNSGVLVLQPEIHAEFLQNIYNNYVIKSISHYRGFHYEQSAIGYELQKEKLYKVLDNKFNALWSLTKLDNIENKSLSQFINENYFIHFAGRTDFDKILDSKTPMWLDIQSQS
jgi:hypothetical protein